MYDKFRKVSCFGCCLFLLLLMDGLSRLTIWPSGGLINTFVNAFQLVIYLVLAFDIIRKHYSPVTYLCVFVSLVLLLIGWSQTRDSVYIRDILLIVAAQGASFEGTARTMRRTVSITVIAGVLTALLGYATTRTYHRGSDIRYTLGFSHPNQLALMLAIIALLWLAERHARLNWIDLLFLTLWTAMTFEITRSRTATALLVFMLVVCAIQVAFPRRSVGGLFTAIAVITPPACLLFTYVSAHLISDNGFLKSLDRLLGNRIWLNWYAFTNHGIPLFGQVVDLSEGTGTVYNDLTGTWNNAITVDNTYALSLVRLGLIPTLVFIVWNMFALKRIAERGDRCLLAMGIVFCIYGITEAQMLDVFNDFILLGAYALIQGRGSKVQDEIGNEEQSVPSPFASGIRVPLLNPVGR